MNSDAATWRRSKGGSENGANRLPQAVRSISAHSRMPDNAAVFCGKDEPGFRSGAGEPPLPQRVITIGANGTSRFPLLISAAHLAPKVGALLDTDKLPLEVNAIPDEPAKLGWPEPGEERGT